MGRELALQRPSLFLPLVAISGVQAATVAAVFGLGRHEAVLRRILPYVVSCAAGVLLATACLDLLPEAVRASGNGVAPWNTLLVTLVLLFGVQAGAHELAERTRASAEGVAYQRASSQHDELEFEPHAHHGHAGHEARPRSSTPLLLGSALHSAVDGVAISAAFAAGSRAGWIAAIAVGLHELPHRAGDFALLLHMGVPKRRAAQLAVGAGAAALIGWLVMVLLRRPGNIAWLLPVSAGTFLYIALVDLLPELHATRQSGRTWWQIACLTGGAALMALLTYLPGE